MAGLVAGYVAFSRDPELQRLLRPEAVRALIADLGSWGPIALILSMAVAIVFSPIPSAPLALAAGALYGHTWGTVYSVIGAEIGALIAFGLARALGRPFVARFLPEPLFSGESGEEEDQDDMEEEDAGRDKAERGIEAEDGDALAGRSQWLLAGGVFVARLFPFISFDAVSYLAGLTDLRWSFFAVATLTGMIPMTFLFAHLGGAMTAGEEPLRILNLLALLGLAGLLWMGWRLRSRRGRPF